MRENYFPGDLLFIYAYILQKLAWFAGFPADFQFSVIEDSVPGIMWDIWYRYPATILSGASTLKNSLNI
jgi:hypothetical protein